MTENLPVFKTNRNSLNQTETVETIAPSSGKDDGSHLDDLRMPELEDEGIDPDGPFQVGEDGEALEQAPPEQLSEEAFWTVFSTAFNIPTMFMRELHPLAIQPHEESTARAASDATYALLQIYYPSALMPQSETLAHLMAAGPFFIGKILIVREIVRAMNAKPVNPPHAEQPRPTPSNNNSEPQVDNDWHLPGQAA